MRYRLKLQKKNNCSYLNVYRETAGFSGNVIERIGVLWQSAHGEIVQLKVNWLRKWLGVGVLLSQKVENIIKNVKVIKKS